MPAGQLLREKAPDFQVCFLNQLLIDQVWFIFFMLVGLSSFRLYAIAIALCGLLHDLFLCTYNKC